MKNLLLILCSLILFVPSVQANETPEDIAAVYETLEEIIGQPVVEDVTTDPNSPSADFVDLGEYLDAPPFENLLHKAGICGTVNVIFRKSARRQTLSAICSNGKVILNNVIASGGTGRRTPVGTFRVFSRLKMAFSRKYGAVMPHFMVFKSCSARRKNCIGIHGAAKHKVTGRPASKGCIRLNYHHARKLFNATYGSRVTVTIR